ncbi:alkaline phosphatase [Bacteroidia bacterium]|nr:alkaline phosphatase [Bacteroidia bacterium]
MKKVMMTILMMVLVFDLAIGQEVKNVIVMIGDGMGVSQVYAGLTANKGSLHLERCQYVGFAKTYSASDYITDSGAGGTAIACGVKTKNGTIGMDTSGNSIPSLLAIASKNGQSTGVVVSCDLTHATPASFIAHQPNRNMTEEIANDYANSDVTVCIGGGRNNFEQRKDGRNITAEMKSKGYQVAYSMDEVAKVKSGKLLGLVAEKHPAAFPERGNMLPDAVSAALDILKNNEKGFFLMVEGSQIDWGGHAKNQEQVINEMLDFDRTIKVAFDFAEKNPNTLVVITADHETGGLSIVGGNLETGEVKASFSTGGHTSVMVPVYSYGTGAKEFAGIYQNTDIKPKILQLYGSKK